MYCYTRAVTYDNGRNNDSALRLVQEPLGAEGKDEPELLILYVYYTSIEYHIIC